LERVLDGHLKAELIQNGRYISLEDARTDLIEFIDGYSNMQRPNLLPCLGTSNCRFQAEQSEGTARVD
jgi:hypothetical protein